MTLQLLFAETIYLLHQVIDREHIADRRELNYGSNPILKFWNQKVFDHIESKATFPRHGSSLKQKLSAFEF